MNTLETIQNLWASNQSAWFPEVALRTYATAEGIQQQIDEIEKNQDGFGVVYFYNPTTGHMETLFHEYTNPPSVYLCGPIADRNDEDVFGWRNEFKSLFKGSCIDPSRRDYRGVEITPEIARQIVQEDLNDINDSDAVVINFDRPSVGSSQEVFYAAAVRGLPVVIINKSGSNNLSPWLIAHSSAIVGSVQEAADVMWKLLGN